MLKNVFACGNRERVRRGLILLMIVAVAYVPGGVALAMLLSGAE